MSRVANKNHMLDATEIFRTLGQHKKETFIRLGFYLVFFFFSLYRQVHLLLSRSMAGCSYQTLLFRMILALVADES